MKVLLDTNAYTALFRGHAGVAARVRRADEVLLLTADRFSRIATALRRKGKPLPTNDVWIAAHAT